MQHHTETQPVGILRSASNPEHDFFNLLRFTSKEDLIRIVQSFCDLTGLSGGVVAMPADPTNPPVNEEEFDNYRLTPPGALNQSAFCKLVRDSACGNRECMWSDLEKAQDANTASQAISYLCHIGLVDIVAPVRVAGHHVANVYLGEIRPPGLDFETVWAKYQRLVRASQCRAQAKTIRHETTKEQLRDAFNRLPVHSDKQIALFASTTEVLAELISQRATRQAAIVVTLDAAHEIGASLNLHGNLTVYLRHAMRLLNANTATIFLLDESKQSLRLIAHAWPDIGSLDLTIQVTGPSLEAKCARENLRRYHGDLKAEYDKDIHTPSRAFIIREGKRAAIDRLGAPLIPLSRDKRDLQSLLVVPITCGGELLGVMDIGSSTQNAFTLDDVHVLRLFSREIGMHVRYTKDRQSLLSAFAEDNPDHLGRVLALEIPRHVRGIGCSIFIKENEHFRLFATSEFPDELKLEGFYEAGEGLTGWVLKTGQPLNLQQGPKCRTLNLPQALKDAGVVWKGKFAHQYSLPREYWEDRPFLAVPVRGASGEIAGAISVPDRQTGSFTASDESILQAFADCLGQVLKSNHSRYARRGSRGPKSVFLGYGQKPDAKNNLQNFLQSLGLKVETYEGRKIIGAIPYEIVRQCIENSDAAVILYTGDDQLASGARIARRNVIYELGVAHWAFGPRSTLFLVENGVEEPTNVAGMQVVRFDPNCLTAKFGEIREYLVKMHLLG
jgi:GAF domain-containing protein/ligand-binding sensor protein